MTIDVECIRRLPLGKFVRMDKTLHIDKNVIVDVVVWSFKDVDKIDRISMFDVKTGLYLGDTE